MTPDAARRMAAHGRRLLTARILSPTEYACLDAMLWRLRRPGRADLTADYRSIARLCGIAVSTAVLAVRKLVDIGLIAKTRRRVRVVWGRGGACVASRVIANAYRFATICTGSDRPHADKGIVRTKGSEALEKALCGLAGAAGYAVPVPS
jgi:hypothetical protein